MHWTWLCKDTTKRYRHLHTPIDSIWSFLKLANICLSFFLLITRCTLVNLFRMSYRWWWINSWRLRANYDILRFGGTCFYDSRDHFWLNQNFGLEMSKRHFTIIRFKSFIDDLILYKNLLILYDDILWWISLMRDPTFLATTFIDRLTVWKISESDSILGNIVKVIIRRILIALIHILYHRVI